MTLNEAFSEAPKFYTLKINTVTVILMKLAKMLLFKGEKKSDSKYRLEHSFVRNGELREKSFPKRKLEYFSEPVRSCVGFLVDFDTDSMSIIQIE